MYNLRRQTDVFLTGKHRADPVLSDPIWLSTMSFFCLRSHPMRMNWTRNFKERINLCMSATEPSKDFGESDHCFMHKWKEETFSHLPCFKEFRASKSLKMSTASFWRLFVTCLNKQFFGEVIWSREKWFTSKIHLSTSIARVCTARGGPCVYRPPSVLRKTALLTKESIVPHWAGRPYHPLLATLVCSSVTSTMCQSNYSWGSLNY